MQTPATKTLSQSKRAQEFERGLREAGISKERSKLLTKKLLLLRQPERIGKLVKRGKTSIYVVSRPTKNGRALIYKQAHGGGESIVIVVPPRAGRGRAGTPK